MIGLIPNDIIIRYKDSTLYKKRNKLNKKYKNSILVLDKKYKTIKQRQKLKIKKITRTQHYQIIKI